MSLVHPMYTKLPPDLSARLSRALARARPGAQVFFRADDAGVPSQAFSELIRLFRQLRIPLDLAVVPAWITEKRFAALCRQEPITDPIFCLHMHGYRHVNHEAQGKKQEFSDLRDESAIFRDLARGKERLEKILSDAFVPAFTPPWNRCGAKALESLSRLGFRAVSRSAGATPEAGRGLASLDVSVDLHTRKEPDAGSAWGALFSRLSEGLAGGRPLGIMIHHQRMNREAFVFLGMLLAALSEHGAVVLQNFRGLVPPSAPDF
ncbi:MAG: polysaccharide deacetylase family protein [Thermodesulfobacteriota bacterium]